MRQRFINNYSTLVAATFGAGDTQLQVASAAGLPILGAGEFFYLTVYRQTGIEEREHEVVKVTNVVGNMLTVVRAVEGAAASQFIAGDRVQARVTAGALQAKADEIDMVQAKQDIAANAAAVATKASQAALASLTDVVNAKAAQADLLTLQDTVNTKASTASVTALTNTVNLKANTADMNAAIAQAKADLLNSAPGALDTLKELADALGGDANFATTTTNALSNRLRIDVAQALSVGQKAQAVANLGLHAVAVSGSYTDLTNKPDLSLKEDAIPLGTVSQYRRGDKSWRDLATDVRAVVMTGYAAVASAAVAATDTFMGAIAKLEAQIAGKLGLTGGTMNGHITMAANHLINARFRGGSVVSATSNGTVHTIDVTACGKHTATATAASSFSFTNWPASGEAYVRVDFINFGNYTITPPTVTWTNPDGTETTNLATHFAALAAAGGRSGFTSNGRTKAVFWNEANGTVYGAFI